MVWCCYGDVGVGGGVTLVALWSDGGSSGWVQKGHGGNGGWGCSVCSVEEDEEG